jgi:hypothetical protein
VRPIRLFETKWAMLSPNVPSSMPKAACVPKLRDAHAQRRKRKANSNRNPRTFLAERA